MSQPAKSSAPAFTRPIVWAVSTAFWIIIGFINAASELVDVITGRQLASYWEPITWELTSALAFAIITPFFIEFALRIRFSRRRSSVVMLAHAIAVVVFSLTHVAGMVAMREITYRIAGSEYSFGHIGWELIYEGLKDSTTYALLMGLTYGFDYYRRFRERQLVTTKLEANLTMARLENLEKQIQPHFLFNTLNMISATMHHDVGAADRMIMRLSDLLRLTMQQKGRQEIPLSTELAMLNAYLEIMQARFEDRLDVDVAVAPMLSDVFVPPLLLQPLVENAIKHGMDHNDSGGWIRVTIQSRGNELLLRIEDDGPGIDEAVVQAPSAAATSPNAVTPRKGTGMANTISRLEGLYGTDQRLNLSNRSEGGLQIDIVIPLRRTPSPEVVSE